MSTELKTAYISYVAPANADEVHVTIYVRDANGDEQEAASMSVPLVLV